MVLIWSVHRIGDFPRGLVPSYLALHGHRFHLEKNKGISQESNVTVLSPGMNSPEAIRAKQADSSEGSELSGEGNETEDNVIAQRRAQGDELVQLGKNASFYLSSIKKIFENV